MKVMVFGTFDLLHEGHRFVLSEAEKRGDVTVVIARDTNVERIKGRRPVESEDTRRENIAKEFPNMQVLLGDDADFLQVVRTEAPDLILFGYDQKLPPSITETMLPCSVERLPSFHPEKYKSSLKRLEEQR